MKTPVLEDQRRTREIGQAADRPPSPMFVHGQIDDFGLSQAQFRVLAHVARRGVCYASVRTIGLFCRMHRDTVCKALRYLLDCNCVTKERKPGHASHYAVNPILATWKLPGQRAQDEAIPANPPDNKGYPSFQAALEKDFPTEAKAHSENLFKQLWDRLRAVLPPKDLRKNNGIWGTLMKQNPTKFDRCLADLESQLKAPEKKIRNPGGILMDNWKRFK